MKNIESIVEAHLADSHFSVEKLCREAGVSHPQLYRKLKRGTGMSAVKFIRHIRLKHAKKLLEDTELAINEVAYDTGFSDPDYFSKVFRKETGHTPSEYRTIRQNEYLL